MNLRKRKTTEINNKKLLKTKIFLFLLRKILLTDNFRQNVHKNGSIQNVLKHPQTSISVTAIKLLS